MNTFAQKPPNPVAAFVAGWLNANTPPDSLDFDVFDLLDAPTAYVKWLGRADAYGMDALPAELASELQDLRSKLNLSDENIREHLAWLSDQPAWQFMGVWVKPYRGGSN